MLFWLISILKCFESSFCQLMDWILTDRNRHSKNAFSIVKGAGSNSWITMVSTTNVRHKIITCSNTFIESSLLTRCAYKSFLAYTGTMMLSRTHPTVPVLFLRFFYLSSKAAVAFRTKLSSSPQSVSKRIIKIS